MMRKSDVADAWFSVGLPGELANLTRAELSKTCWACWRETGQLQLAHIQARAAGGDNNDPLNRFLLCAKCHREQPDGVPKEVQWAWLHSRQSYLSWMVVTVLKEFRVACEALDLKPEEMPEAIPEGLGPPRCYSAHRETLISNVVWHVAQGIQKEKLLSQGNVKPWRKRKQRNKFRNSRTQYRQNSRD